FYRRGHHDHRAAAITNIDDGDDQRVLQSGRGCGVRGHSNVRELENALERAVVLGSSDHIRREDFLRPWWKLIPASIGPKRGSPQEPAVKPHRNPDCTFSSQ